jgi:hypothetical protein
MAAAQTVILAGDSSCCGPYGYCPCGPPCYEPQCPYPVPQGCCACGPPVNYWTPCGTDCAFRLDQIAQTIISATILDLFQIRTLPLVPLQLSPELVSLDDFYTGLISGPETCPVRKTRVPSRGSTAFDLLSSSEQRQVKGPRQRVRWSLLRKDKVAGPATFSERSSPVPSKVSRPIESVPSHVELLLWRKLKPGSR